MQRIARRKVQYKMGMCIGIQLDMWTNTDTHTSYGCISMSEIEEPKAGMIDPQLWLSLEILAFSVFPFNSKTGENIKAWLVAELADVGLEHVIISGVAPDGAADGQCGLRLIVTLTEKVDTCLEHVLQRGVLVSIGLANKPTKNALAKGLLQQNARVVQLSNQNLKFAKGLRDAQEAAGVPDHQACTSPAGVPLPCGFLFTDMGVVFFGTPFPALPSPLPPPPTFLSVTLLSRLQCWEPA